MRLRPEIQDSSVSNTRKIVTCPTSQVPVGSHRPLASAMFLVVIATFTSRGQHQSNTIAPES